MRALILASTIFGMPVSCDDGASERLKDLGVVKEGDSWRIVAVRTTQRDVRFARWAPDCISAAAVGAVEATWLREALFDRQIVDLDGRRVIRVADVMLGAEGDVFEVIGVEVGAAAVLRRLGFGRLAARLKSQLLPIDRLHVPSAAAGGLQLDAPRERLEQLEAETVTELLSRLPVSAAEHAVRTSRHREALARHAHIRRRRGRNPRTPR